MEMRFNGNVVYFVFYFVVFSIGLGALIFNGQVYWGIFFMVVIAFLLFRIIQIIFNGFNLIIKDNEIIINDIKWFRKNFLVNEYTDICIRRKRFFTLKAIVGNESISGKETILIPNRFDVRLEKVLKMINKAE